MWLDKAHCFIHKWRCCSLCNLKQDYKQIIFQNLLLEELATIPTQSPLTDSKRPAHKTTPRSHLQARTYIILSHHSHFSQAAHL